MKRSVLKRFFATITVLCVMLFSTVSYAHPGRTDKNGGHKDNQNKSGLGSYHYHCGDYDAHLHTNGYCPYSSSGRSSTTTSSKKTTEVSKTVAAIVEEKPIEKKIVEAEKPVQKIVEKQEEAVLNNIVEEVNNVVETKDIKEEKKTEEIKYVEAKQEGNENKIDNSAKNKEIVIDKKNESVEKIENKKQEKETTEIKVAEKEEIVDEIIVATNKESQETVTNESQLIDENSEGGSGGGLGAVLLLGGAGYLGYKKIRG